MADEEQSAANLTDGKAGRSKTNKFYEFFSEKNYKFFLFAILIFAFVVRLYYFYLTRSQALWWDEAEYMSIAKHWLYGLDYSINPQRMPLIPLLAAGIFKLGGGTGAAKFFLSLLPSVGIIGLFYALGAKMYDKKTGLLAAVLVSVSWVLLFWTNRINTDMLAFLLALCGVYFAWAGLVTKENPQLAYGVLPAFVLAFLAKPNMVLVFISLAIFLLAYLRLELLMKKELALSALLAVPIAVVFLVWEKIQFGDWTAFRGATFVLMRTPDPAQVARPVGWHVLNFVYLYPEKLLFWVAMFGLVIFVFNLIAGRDLIRRNSQIAANLLLLLLLAVVLAYFVFIERDAEDRWVLPIALPLFMAAAAGFGQIWRWLGRASKSLAFLVVAGLLVSGVYLELARADSMIKAKISSYQQVKDAALWMKEHSFPGDYLVTWSEPQTLYYSERKQLTGYGNETEFEARARQYRPKYLTVSAFERHPDWFYSYPQRHNSSLEPVQAYYLDKEHRQLALVIYEFRNYAL